AIETISVGDRSLWQIIPANNRLFIRPMQKGITTNMTLLTNKRAYQFDLKSLGEGDKNDNVVYVVKFLYPKPIVYTPPPPPPPPPVMQAPPPPPPVAQMPPPPPPVADLTPKPVPAVY